MTPEPGRHARRQRGRAVRARALGAAGLLALGACANNPPAPAWEIGATDALGRVRTAWFAGDARAEAAEFETVRRETARTGQPALVARVELVRCALRVATLVVEECAGFQALAADAGPAEQAYAAYLRGRATATQVPLLPAQHQPLARGGTSGSDAAALDRIADPLSRLVAASVLLQTGRGTPAVVRRAVDAASAQGWRQPLRAWLHVQLRQAEAMGDAAEVARIERRIALVALTPTPAGQAGSR